MTTSSQSLSSASSSTASTSAKLNKVKKQRVFADETENKVKEGNIASTQLFISSLETLKRLYPSYKSKYLEQILLEYNGDFVSASKQLSLSNKDQSQKATSKQQYEQTISPILKQKNDQVSNYLSQQNENNNNNNMNETLPSMFDGSFKCYPPSSLMQSNYNHFNPFIQNPNGMPKPSPFAPMYFGQGNFYDQKYPNTYLNDQTALALQQFNAAVASIPFSYRHQNAISSNNNSNDSYNPFQFPYFPPLAQTKNQQQNGFSSDIFSYSTAATSSTTTATTTITTSSTPSLSSASSNSSSSSSSPSLQSNGLLCISSSTPKGNLTIDTHSNHNNNKNIKQNSK